MSIVICSLVTVREVDVTYRKTWINPTQQFGPDVGAVRDGEAGPPGIMEATTRPAHGLSSRMSSRSRAPEIGTGVSMESTPLFREKFSTDILVHQNISVNCDPFKTHPFSNFWVVLP